MRVVATAGHVDHGKSSLVLALTGTDPDRWEEEKRRGLTIDLGFAFTTLPSGAEVGFVDVPGHVRFLKNMLAGAGAVDAAVLVVAAPEGWMPQAEEHLRILELLGVEHGLTVLTMADLVPPDALDLTTIDVTEHLAGTFLSKAPVVACDSHSGRGLDEVRAGLDDLVVGLPPPRDVGRPRLWVDRAFSAHGAGTVVTGTLTRGRLSVGDEVVAGPRRRRARVRAIQSGHADAAVALPGARVALNLSGVDRRDVARGHAVVLDGDWVHTQRIEAHVTVLPDSSLKARQGLKVYLGSGEYDSVVRALGEGFVRIDLPTPLPLAPGDRVVLRDPGAGRTVGGGEIRHVDPPARVARAADRLRLPVGGRVLATHPVTSSDEFGRLAGSAETIDEVVRTGAAILIGEHVIATQEAERVGAEARAAARAFHDEHPLEPGVDLLVLAARVGVEVELLRSILAGDDEVVVEGGVARLHAHRGAAAADPIAQAFLDAVTQAPFTPPSPAETGTPLAAVRALVASGEVIETEGQYFSTAAYRTAVRLVREALAVRGTVTVGDVRDVLGSSRKHVLPLLNRMDREGVTRRTGEVREAGPTRT